MLLRCVLLKVVKMVHGVSMAGVSIAYCEDREGLKGLLQDSPFYSPDGYLAST